MENKTRKRKPGGGRKPKAYTLFKKRIEEEQIDDADYAFWLHAETMRDDSQPLQLRLDCADWVMNRVKGKPTQMIGGDSSKPIEVRLRVIRDRTTNRTSDTPNQTAPETGSDKE